MTFSTAAIASQCSALTLGSLQCVPAWPPNVAAVFNWIKFKCQFQVSYMQSSKELCFPTMIFRYVLGNIGRLELRAGRVICISWGEMSRFTKNKCQFKCKHKYTCKYTQINPYLIFFNFGIPLHYLGLQKYTKSCVNSQQNSQNLPK